MTSTLQHQKNLFTQNIAAFSYIFICNESWTDTDSKHYQMQNAKSVVLSFNEGDAILIHINDN
jgi:hypothetical protein